MTLTSFVFTELADTMTNGGGSYRTLLSSRDVTEFHRMNYGGGGLIYPCFHRVTPLRFTEYDIISAL